MNHCRIGKIKLKHNGTEISLLENKRMGEFWFGSVDGEVMIRARGPKLRRDTALMLLKFAEDEVLNFIDKVPPRSNAA